jgi:hypothetical protein
MDRELRRPAPGATRPVNPVTAGRRRFDPPQDLFAQLDGPAVLNLGPIASQSTITDVLRSRRTDGSQILAWLIVVAGSAALFAGVGLIGWSLAEARMIHWNLALGLALGGQGTLILGLVLVVSRLWRTSRCAARKLQDVHARLGHLQKTAEALATNRTGGAPAFYADLVRGASPQVLLANLKGQVDQLATRLGGGC